MSEKPVVAICVPIYDSPKTEFWRSFRTLWKPSSASAMFQGGVTHIFDTQGMLIVQARQGMTLDALEAEPKVSHVLFIDDDMVFPPHALKRLLDHDRPIVGGLCHNRRHPYPPVLARLHPECLERSEKSYGFLYHYPPDALVEVDATGGAFLLIRRDVFEAIREKFGPVWWAPLEGEMSEDFSFCARAKACGFPIVVDTGLEIGHVAEVVVDAAFAKKNRRFQWDAWVPYAEAVKDGVPQVSVVIPVYNQKPRLLKAAVLSAAYQGSDDAGALAPIPVEVIVIDDGSEPPVPTYGWPPNVRVLRHESNRGIAAALNTGIAAMKTEMFAWLSSDDLFDPRKVQIQFAAMQQSGAVASFHRYQVLLDESQEAHPRYSVLPGWRTNEEMRRVLAKACAINGSTVMIRREIFAKKGTFDERLKYGQDWEMWCRIAEHCFWLPIEEILGTRRESGNLTEAIEKDPEKTKIRDAEDRLIQDRYVHWT